MSKKRDDTPRNPIEWFMSNLLFTQSFEFETSVDIHTVVERLHEKSHERNWRQSYPRFVLTTEPRHDHYWFDLRAKDDRQKNTIIHATGSIESTAQDGALLSGELRFGVVYFFLLGVSVLWMFFIFQFFGLRMPSWMLIIVMAGPALTFGHMFWKRHHVLKDIRESITPRMTDRNFEKLKRQDLDETDPTLVDDEDESQTYGRQ